LGGGEFTHGKLGDIARKFCHPHPGLPLVSEPEPSSAPGKPLLPASRNHCSTWPKNPGVVPPNRPIYRFMPPLRASAPLHQRHGTACAAARKRPSSGTSAVHQWHWSGPRAVRSDALPARLPHPMRRSGTPPQSIGTNRTSKQEILLSQWSYLCYFMTRKRTF